MAPPLKPVGTQGYIPIPLAPPGAEAPGHTGGPPPAQIRASDIPPSAAAHGPEGAETAEPVDISKARSVPQSEQTHAQREAKKATAEKPSFLKKIFAGIAGAISGAIGGVMAGLLAAGGVAVVVGAQVTAGGSGEAGLVAGAAAFLLAGAPVFAASVIGGAIAGGARAGSQGDFIEAFKAAATPVKFVIDLVSKYSKTESPQPPPAPDAPATSSA
jgi:hypothetical protein